MVTVEGMASQLGNLEAFFFFFYKGPRAGHCRTDRYRWGLYTTLYYSTREHLGPSGVGYDY